MGRPNIKEDAKRAFDVLHGGGTAILPMDVGYSLIGGSEKALSTIFETKGRAPSKLNAMLADMELHHEIHQLDSRGREIVDAITIDYDLPLGTVLMLLNAGEFHREICRLSREAVHPLFGSSANKSLQGTKFRVQDMEPEITGIADIIIDHGLRKYHLYQASSTLLNLQTLEVVRFGSCYELIADIMLRHFKVELPEAPTKPRRP